MNNIKFRLEAEIGGFIWWRIIKLGKTKLEEETGDDNAPRNIFVFYLLLGLLFFISFKYF
jgi:hypothetical protein